MDKLSRILGVRDQAASVPESHVLAPFEIRLIAEGKLEKLAEFTASSRLSATDAKGDTPLHLAARMGSLTVCDLFIRSGADPAALNYEQQTPADLAFSEGHSLAAQLLYSLIVASEETQMEPVCDPEVSIGVENVIAATDSVSERTIAEDQEKHTADRSEDLDDTLTFEAETEPEKFFELYAGDKAAGTFAALLSSSAVGSGIDDGDWNVNLLDAPISGEGIGSSPTLTTDHSEENDFLKARKRGRQSVKRAVVQTGTRMSIDPDLCFDWSIDILAKGQCSLDDIERLIIQSKGNGDFDELCTNIRCIMEVAGFDFNKATGIEADLWDPISDTLSEDLADALLAALTRRKRLPGTQRFTMDKSYELQLLEFMMRAKQKLQLCVLASEIAVEIILNVLSRIYDGSRDPRSVSLRTIVPSRPGHPETSEVMAAAETLRSWHTSDRLMDGKRRREALAALEALELSLAFYKELINMLRQFPAGQADASQLEAELLISESATEELIREHLPYVRRFASRNVEEGEDPEEVFQVAFMGLQRSTRRFDPERGYRFLTYATFWMRQAIKRWRYDEGAVIRIPVHRSEKITKLDHALERLGVQVNGAVSDLELAEELEWTVDEVIQFRSIPRVAEYPGSIEDWDKLLSEPSEKVLFDQSEAEKIVAEALADLPERQAEVIRLRFGIGHETDMTLEEIGQIYGVTRERIRQIEAKAIQRLSHPGRLRRLRSLLDYEGGQRSLAPTTTSAARLRDSRKESCKVTHQTPSWTVDRMECLKQLWAQGMSAREIAQELGDISRNAVIGKLNRLGLTVINREKNL